MIPKVTVLMSVYNGARFLREAVDSILAQTMPDFEFLIIDDGSTDETLSILASYHDPRIRIVRQENQGLAAALNRGLQMASAELVARMDADDIALPDRLATQLAAYERLGHPDVLGGAVEVISEAGASLKVVRFPQSHEAIVHNLVHGGAAFAHPTVLYKRQAVLQRGGYDTFFCTSTEDYDLWLQMSGNSCYANLPQVVLRLRLNSSGMESRRAAATATTRSSSAWYHCLAKQRYLLNQQGLTDWWGAYAMREQVFDALWLRFRRSGMQESMLANRYLALIRADLRTPGRRIVGLKSALWLCAAHPLATLRYVFTRRHPEPRYLDRTEVERLAAC